MIFSEIFQRHNLILTSLCLEVLLFVEFVGPHVRYHLLVNAWPEDVLSEEFREEGAIHVDLVESCPMLDLKEEIQMGSNEFTPLKVVSTAHISTKSPQRPI